MFHAILIFIPSFLFVSWLLLLHVCSTTSIPSPLPAAILEPAQLRRDIIKIKIMVYRSSRPSKMEYITKG